MTVQSGGATAPGLGSAQAPNDNHNRPNRNPYPIGVAVGCFLAAIGAFMLLCGIFAGPSFVNTHYGPDWWIDTMQGVGRTMISGIPLGAASLAVGVVACTSATWLRPRYPGRHDFRNNLAVRLYDEFGDILHPGDVIIMVHRHRGVYRVLVRLEAIGLQYEAKRNALIKAVVGMGFKAPEVYPYRGPGIYDLDALVVSRLITDGHIDRWRGAIAHIRNRMRGGR